MKWKSKEVKAMVKNSQINLILAIKKIDYNLNESWYTKVDDQTIQNQNNIGNAFNNYINLNNYINSNKNDDFYNKSESHYNDASLNSKIILNIVINSNFNLKILSAVLLFIFF